MPLLGYDSDDVLTAVFVRVPAFSHGALRAVCRRANTLLTSPVFREARQKSGFAEAALVIAGGVRDGRATAECWMLTGGMRCRPIARMTTPRAFGCSAVMDNELFVLGGSAGGDALATVEAYDPRRNTWRLLPPMGQGRQGAVCGVVGGVLVVTGGGSLHGGSLASAEAFSPATGWTPLPPMPHEAWSAAACVVGGRLYVAGGVSSRTLQMWDGAEWRVLSDLPAARNGAAGAALDDGRFMVMGGRVSGASATTSVLLYDPRTDGWVASAPLPELRRRAHAWCTAIEHEGAVVLFGDQSALRFRDNAWAKPPYPLFHESARACLGSMLLG
jgi:hypothetical protein